MSQITIQCRLIASPETRQHLWRLMAEHNTLLVNEIIAQIKQHPNFESWKLKGSAPVAAFDKLANNLRSDPRFEEHPQRFCASAGRIVYSMFESWLALQKDSFQRLQKTLRWLDKLKSDEELVEACGCELNQIRAQADQVLKRITRKNSQSSLTQPMGGDDKKKLSDALYKAALYKQYDKTDNPLMKSAICYLLKNGCELSEQDEDLEKLTEKRLKAELRVQKLQRQINASMPVGRDLTFQLWENILEIATVSVPQDEDEAKDWQTKLLKKPKFTPYPIFYRNKEELTWSEIEIKGRTRRRGKNYGTPKKQLCVKFGGLGKHIFKVSCDRRQLHWFKRFLEDQQTKQESNGQCSSSLFTLRSAQLVWHEQRGKGNPWDVHHLHLHCTVEIPRWTAEGTEQIRQAERLEVAQDVANLKEKETLSEGQQDHLQRLESQLKGLDYPFSRPSRPLYTPQPNIIAGVSIGLQHPATLVILNSTTQEILVTRTIRELLGKNYGLLLRRRCQQQKTSHQRHKAQKQNASNQFGESDLGEYVDRLIAKEIVTIVKAYRANSIVVPNLTRMREMLDCEVMVKAIQRCPGAVKRQALYAKEYRKKIHRWSYRRLITNIQIQASQVGITIEEAQQPFQGTPEEKAKELAIAAYQSRKK